MTLVQWQQNPYSPFSEMDAFLEKISSDKRHSYLPPMDVYQDEEAVHVRVQLPGFKKEHIRVSIEGNVLSVSGETKKSSEVEDTAYYRKEIRVGSFQRIVELPVVVDESAAQADFEHGELHITVPKKTGSSAKRIEITEK